MSNGTRLIAVVVVVVLAAIGLYYAFLFNPNPTPAVPVPVNNVAPVGSAETATAPTGGLTEGKPMVIIPPPAGAFAPPGAAAANKANTGASIGAPTPVGGSAPSVSPTTPTSPNFPISTPSPSTTHASTEYTVQSGDTFEGLARRFLGDASKSRVIQDANPGVSPTNLQIGQKLKIPGANLASGATPTSKPAAGSTTTANTYTVQSGDSLMAISRKVYGNDTDWRRILEANATLLKGNAQAIQPGMKLTIPAKR
jgi:nucleoid-associated protein YgaU